MSDIEGKVTRVGASERGQRMSFNPASGPITSEPAKAVSKGENLKAETLNSLVGNGRLLSAKHIFLDLARRCFWQLGLSATLNR
jgi:hypothetical protein